MRTKILMICAHEPRLDPRIRWEAAAASQRFDVTVLGFADDSRPERDEGESYRTVRVPRPHVSAAYYLWRLKDVLPAVVYIPLAALAVLFAPFLIVVGAASCILRGTMQKAGIAALLRRSKLSAVIGWARRRFLMRLEYIIAVSRAQFAPAAVAFWRYVRDMPQKPDVVHCNDLDTLLVGVMAKQHYGCCIVYDAHEFYPVSDPHGNWIDITFFSLLERCLIRKADAVVTVNTMLADEMRAAYGLERVYSVPNAEPWVNDLLPPLRGEMDRLASGRLKFLFQGRFTPGRGIDELIEGWAMADGSRAALFLRGPNNQWRDAAIAKAAQLDVLDLSVYFLDAVSEDELVTAASEADVGIIPYKPLIVNDRLSCPNKLSQYLHAGLLVLANDLPYVKSVLTEAEAGVFYSSADLRTLSVAVTQILDDPDLLRRSRVNARRFARDRFNWQVQGEVLLALYQGAEDWKRAATMTARSHASAA